MLIDASHTIRNKNRELFGFITYYLQYAVESVQYTDLQLGQFSSFYTIWQSRTGNTAAVNSSPGINTALTGATRALPMATEQWILSLQLISLR